MATVSPDHRRVRAHPIHGMLAAYPLACFSAALVSDTAYASTAQMQWANFSVWLITGGVIMGVLAGIAGIFDAVAGRSAPRKRHWPHSVSVALMLGLAIVNAFVHSRDAWTSVVPTGLVLSAIVAALALATSWMSYSLETWQEAK